MRTRTKAALLFVGMLALSGGIGTGVAVYLQPEPAVLACPDIQPIQETRQITVMTWPVPDAATQIQAPHRATKRRKVPLISTAPVEQCSPSSVGAPSSGVSSHLIPEPGSLALVGVGGAALFIARRKARRSC